MLLKNKTVIITGSSRGIGSDIATLFAKEGANLVLNYRQDYTAASRLKDNLLQYNNNIEVFKADITQRNEVKQLFNQTIRSFKKIDVLINNAGINSRSNFLDTTDEQWDKIMKTNLYGPFICVVRRFSHL